VSAWLGCFSTGIPAHRRSRGCSAARQELSIESEQSSTSTSPGTAFQIEVWSALIEIPPGTTATYGAIAGRLGRPRAARAVGAANGQNPISIIVPCHRLVGADGSLTGYGWGLDRKRRLIAHERQTGAGWAEVSSGRA
jgi:methylated-DNA-[protein]-cysteine S-methyltransferase